MKRRLVKNFIRDNVAQLGGLPTPFRLVVGRVKQQSVAMPVWIYPPAHRPGRSMDALCPDRISSYTIVIRSADPNPRLDRGLHIVHRFPDPLVNQFLNFLILGFGQVHANALWNREREIDADTPIINLFFLRDPALSLLVEFPYNVSTRVVGPSC